MRTFGRLLLIGGLLGLLLTVLDVSPASAENNVHHFNMCHRVCSQKSSTDNITYASSPAVVQYVVSISSPRPLAVSLNEVCFSQISSLISAMASMGYSYGGWTNVITAHPGGACGDYGNAIFHLGNFLSSFELNFTTQHSDDGDDRGMVCVKYDAFAHPVTCSAHLSHKKTGAYHVVAAAQAVQYQFEITGTYPSTCRQAAGDFNLEPTELASSWKTSDWDPNWDEADEPSPWQATYGTAKIDWVWLSDSQHSETFWMDVDPVYSSDHKYLVAYFTLTSCP